MDIPKGGRYRHLCCECGKVYNSAKSLYRHVRLKHNKLKILKEAELKEKEATLACSDEGTKTVQVLDLSVERVHRYKCSECDRTSDATGALYKHMRRRHKGLRIIKKSDKKGKKMIESVSCKSDNNEGAVDYNKGVVEDQLEDLDLGTKRQTVEVLDIPVLPVHQYKCSECDKTSDCTSVLYNHMKRHHKGFKILRKRGIKGNKKMSFFNAANFDNVERQDNINVNQEVCQNGGRYRHLCCECGKVYINAKSLYRHVRLKHNKLKILKKAESAELKEVCQNGGRNRHLCCECGKVYNSAKSLYRHVRLKHNKLKILKEAELKEKEATLACSDEGTKTVQVLDLSVERVHRYKCSECDRTSDATGTLYKHMRRQHKGLRIIKKSDKKGKKMIESVSCKSDNNEGAVDYNKGVVEDQLEDLDLGTKRQTVEVLDIPVLPVHQYKCSECDKTSDCTSVLYNHMKRHHKGFKILSKRDIKRNKKMSFFNAANFDNVERQDNINVNQEVCQNGGRNRYPCCGCGKVYISAKSLYRHVRLKHNKLKILKEAELKEKEVTLACSDEGTKTVQVLDLSVERVHQYKCSECDKTSDATGALYKHMRRQHKGLRIIKKRDKKGKKMIESVSCKSDNNEGAVDYNKGVVEDQLEDLDLGTKRQTVEVLDIPVLPVHQYKCSECDKTSDCTSVLYKHMKSHHKGFKILRKKDIKRNKKMSFFNAANFDNVERQDNINVNQEVCQNGLDDSVEAGECSDLGNNENHKESILGMKRSIVCDDHESVMIRGYRQDTVGANDNDKDPIYVIDIPDTGYGRYKCSQCDEKSLHISNLYKHMEYHHTKFRIIKRSEMKNKIISPSISANATKNQRAVDYLDLNVSEYTASNDNARGNKINRNIGIGGLPAKSILIIETSENEGQLYKCSVCGETSTCSSDIAIHMKEEHKGFHVQYQNFLVKRKTCGDNSDIEKEMNDFFRSDSEEDCYDGRGDDYVPQDEERGGGRYKCSEGSETSHSTSHLCKHMRSKHTRLNNVDDKIKVISKGKKDSITIIPVEKNGIDDSSTSNGETIGTERIDVRDNREGLVYKPRKKHSGFKILKRRGHSDIAVSQRDRHCGDRIRRVVQLRVNSKKLYKCSLCSFIRSSSAPIYTHMRLRHKGYRPLKKIHFSESNTTSCDYGMNDETHPLKTVEVLDLDTDTEGAKLYKCSQCDETSNIATCLYTHMERKHKGFEIIKRTDHIVQVRDVPDTGNGSYKCSECHQTSTCTSELYKHMRSKHKSFNIVKRHEDNGFDENNYISAEKSHVHGSSCVDSNFKISNDDEVVRTGQIETVQALPLIPRVGNYRYKCSECGQLGSKPFVLHRHMRTKHKGLRILKAKGNGNSDKNTDVRKGDLNNDNRRALTAIDAPENGKNRYKCSLCFYSSSCTSAIYKHMRRIHKDYRIKKRREEKSTFEIGNNGNSDKNTDVRKGDLNNDNHRTLTAIDAPGNGKNRYKCSLCFYSSSCTSAIYKHMRRIHKDYRIKKRREEKSTFEIGNKWPEFVRDAEDDLHAYLRLKDHIFLDSDDGDIDKNVNAYSYSSYECCVCMDVFPNCEELDNHLKTHKYEEGSGKPSIFDYE